MGFIALKPSAPNGTTIPAQNLGVSSSVVAFTAFNSNTTNLSFQVSGGDVYCTLDGTSPSSSNGAKLYAGQDYNWDIATARFAKFIRVSTSAVIYGQEMVNALDSSELPNLAIWKSRPLTSGTVTSIGMTVPTFLSVSPSAIAGSGTFAITLSGTALPVTSGGTGATSLPSTEILVGNGTGSISASPNLTTDGSGNTSQAGNAAFQVSGDGPLGNTGNNNAAAGVIGEIKSGSLSSLTPVAITSNTATNICSVALTAGVWLCWGYVYFTVTTGTPSTQLFVGAVSTTTASLPSVNSGQTNQSGAIIAYPGVDGCLPIIPVRIKTSSTATAFLIAGVDYSGGAFSGYGGLLCQRQMN